MRGAHYLAIYWLSLKILNSIDHWLIEFLEKITHTVHLSIYVFLSPSIFYLYSSPFLCKSGFILGQSIEKRKAEAKLKPKAKCKSKSRAKKEKAKVEETLPTNHFEGLADTELDEENSDYVDGMPYSDDDESMGEPKEE